MHIIHLGKYYHPLTGGMESLIRSQAQTQVQAGHQVDVVVVNHLSRSGNDVFEKSVGVTHCSFENICGVNVHRVGRVGNFAKWDITTSLRKTLRRIGKSQPDIWHLHTPNATMVLGMQGLLALCSPLVVTHHSDIFNQQILRHAYELIERRIYRHASMIFSDSPAYVGGSSQLSKFLSKVDILPIGVDLAEYQNPSVEVLDTERQFRDSFGDIIWLCVGRLATYKGLEIAIEALTKVEGNLIIIGVGPCDTSLKSLAENLGVSDRVHWLGRCSGIQLRAAYRAATALWFPSNARNEGFGIVQVEAMASGCPVINTDLPHSGVTWVCPHEVSGLTVPVNDPQALSRAAHRILKEPVLREKLSRAARQRAAEMFDRVTINEKCIHLYQSVLDRCGRPSAKSVCN